jgi:membrane protein YqaA with SNARE-associated domain
MPVLPAAESPPASSAPLLRRLYDWTLALAAHHNARWVLGGVSFAESSFFPIPPDVLLIPMIIAERARAWSLALIATVTSVIGGIAGYAIGYFLFDLIGEPIIGFYGAEAGFTTLRDWYNEWGAWIVFAAGLTPIPYKIFTIFSGVTHLDILIFISASLASRGTRFFAVAGLLYWLGPPVRDFVERRLGLVFALFVIGLVGGFVVVNYLI